LEKIFMNNFLLSEEITSAFPKLLGNFSWVLGQCSSSSAPEDAVRITTPCAV
jgi:hypothetical protein